MGYNPPTTTPSKKAPAKKSKPALPKPTPRKRTTTKENANPTATRTPIAAKVRTIDNDQGSRPEDEMDIDGPTNPEEALVDLDDNSLEKMKAELASARAEKAALQKKVQALEGHTKGGRKEEDSVDTVPKPKGTAGTDYSIQEAMGLSGGQGSENYETYKAIQRFLHELLFNANISWEMKWADVPAADKGKLYAAARSDVALLKRFKNDWATEEICKQYIKNKRKHSYNKGWLEVPTQYAYLRANSSKRNQSGSRKKRALANAAARKAKGKARAQNIRRATVEDDDHGDEEDLEDTAEQNSEDEEEEPRLASDIDG